MLTPVPTKRLKRIADHGPHHVVAQGPATGREAPTVDFESVTSPSAEEIADALRRSTLRAHYALKDAATAMETLRSIRDEVAELEGEIDRLGLRKLRPFLAALRHRIEGPV